MAQAIKQLPDKQRIDKAISYWIKRHLQRNLPQVIIPQTEQLLEDTSMLATNIQKWYHHAHESGVMQGVMQGVIQGELQGFAKILEVQLRAKFHDVNDADFMPKLHTADQQDLMRYSVQLLTATSLEQVFS
jgi:flagellar biosynthesis/type III secretory pathway protein FliH